jgi:hypothetical protein
LGPPESHQETAAAAAAAAAAEVAGECVGCLLHAANKVLAYAVASSGSPWDHLDNTLFEMQQQKCNQVQIDCQAGRAGWQAGSAARFCHTVTAVRYWGTTTYYSRPPSHPWASTHCPAVIRAL